MNALNKYAAKQKLVRGLEKRAFLAAASKVQKGVGMARKAMSYLKNFRQGAGKGLKSGGLPDVPPNVFTKGTKAARQTERFQRTGELASSPGAKAFESGVKAGRPLSGGPLAMAGRGATKAAVRLGHKGPNPYGKFVGGFSGNPVAAGSARGMASKALLGVSRGAHNLQSSPVAKGNIAGMSLIGGGAAYAKKQQRAREAMANRPLSSRMGTAQVPRIMAKPKPRQMMNIPAGKPIIGRQPQSPVAPSRWSGISRYR